MFEAQDFYHRMTSAIGSDEEDELLYNGLADESWMDTYYDWLAGE